jgi:enoyl-CoA hydratase
MDEQHEDRVLTVEQRGDVRYLTLNRPEVLNALNTGVFAALEEELTSIGLDSGTRAVVISGAGDRAFSAGADLDELADLDPVDRRALLEQGQRILRGLETLGTPTISAVGGYALGGGFELALSCTLIVASESAKFGLPEVGLGLIPGYGGTQRLPKNIGRQAALKMMLTGERIDAARAHELGLLCQPPTPDADLLEVAGTLAESISEKSPRAANLILKSVGYADSLDAALAHETTLAALAADSGDAEEGISAFREKRAPNFVERR